MVLIKVSVSRSLNRGSVLETSPLSRPQTFLTFFFGVGNFITCRKGSERYDVFVGMWCVRMLRVPEYLIKSLFSNMGSLFPGHDANRNTY